MIKYQCGSCGAIYSDTCKDGLEYYHTCALVQVAEDIFEERPDKRNENVDVYLEGKGKTEIK